MFDGVLFWVVITACLIFLRIRYKAFCRYYDSLSDEQREEEWHDRQ